MSRERIAFTLPSSPDYVRPLYVFVQELALSKGMTEERAHELALAVEEAIMNAILHGNRSDPEKNVEIEITQQAREITVSITDQGAGFRPEDVPDPTAPENLERASGRGILFMRTFTDDLRFEDRSGGGTRVFLRKSYEPPAAEPQAAGTRTSRTRSAKTAEGAPKRKRKP